MEDEDLNFHNIKSLPDEDKEKEEYYYEGEFVEGYKNGLGRLYEPDGSYTYCRWEFDRKCGEILRYNAKIHKWCIYTYDDTAENNDYYANIDNTKEKNLKINIVKLY
jgi:hypothetical protein